MEGQGERWGQGEREVQSIGIKESCSATQPSCVGVWMGREGSGEGGSGHGEGRRFNVKT